MPETAVFEELESEVRIYCRRWPAVFVTARDCHLSDEQGNTYIDFFSGAGTLNYGHNNPRLKEALLKYLGSDALVHSLDMFTPVKRQFLQDFHQEILEPRGLRYKVQFPGPAGTLAIEAAFKLARKYTGRQPIVSFANSFHGMTLEALRVTGRAGGPAEPIVLPYDRPQDPDAPGLARLERLLAERAGRADAPAAVVVETIQGEGGMYTATADWLRRLASICLSHDTLLIIDDVQMGCGRTGPFFSFEHSGIYPDIVCVSKSLSGYGLPMALTLLRPELDVWAPGEHTGTFRGSGPALATAIAAIDLWRGEDLEQQTLTKGKVVEHALRGLAADYGDAVTEIRGRGLAWGLAFREPELAQAVCARAFERGLIVETSGRTDDVVKLLPPLIAAEEDLTDGLDLLRDAVAASVPGQAT